MKICSIIMSFITILCLFGLVEFYGCSADDDDDVTSTATATPVEETPTPMPTATPTVTPTSTTTPEPGTGILNIWTTPVSGDIYVDGQWQGWGLWQAELPVGVYTVSFGNVAGFITPEAVVVYVLLNETTHVEGLYMITFIKRFGGYSADIGRSVQQTADGGYVIAGYTNSFGTGNEDVYLIKTDLTGNKLWSKTFGGNELDGGNSVQQTSDGGYVVAGVTYSFGPGDADVLLIKTAGNGNELWSKTYGGASEEYGFSVQQTSDGGYVIVGHTSSFGAGSSDIYLVKTDGNGNELWSKTYGGASTDGGFSVQQTSNGGFVIVGYTSSFGAGSSDTYLIMTDGNGNELWSKTFGGASSDCGYSVRQTSDGGYVIVGRTYSFGAGYQDVYLIKTDGNGNELWSQTFGGGNGDEGYSVQQTSDGGYVIAGRTESFGVVRAVYLIKTDGNGNKSWSRKYGYFWDNGWSVQQTSDRGFVIAGQTESFGAVNEDVLLIKTDPNGNI